MIPEVIYSGIYKDFAHLDYFAPGEVIFQPDDLENKNSILILHGGADISPTIYNHGVATRTGATAELSKRDRIEVALARRAIEMGIPIFGICRGAQLLTALAGGSLVQDVSGHVGGKHYIQTIDNELILTTSAHHQMCNPWTGAEDFELLAWSSIKRSEYYTVQGDAEIEMKVEPEVIYYPSIKGLAVQGHPEWMEMKSQFVQYCLKLVEEKLCSMVSVTC